MQDVIKKADIGVIVGRFQVHELHTGHRELIDTVLARHNKVLIIVGSPKDVQLTRNNPLDYYTRYLMLKEAYPDVLISCVKDQPTNEGWSKYLDMSIESHFENGSILLYGSRDGFMPYYSGKFETVELEATKTISGTQIRSTISTQVRRSPEFRRGVVYAAFARHPVAYPTIDVIIRKEDSIILGRKKNDPKGKWRFPGGFVDPTDKTLESTVLRELREEVGDINVDTPKYLCSHNVDDWRYKNEIDSIMTTVFTCNYLWGRVQAGDDLDEVMEVPIKELSPSLMVKGHIPILETYLLHLEKEENDG